MRIRGVPADGLFFEGNRVAIDSVTDAIEQTGVPGRFDTDANGWVRMFLSGNQFGFNFS